MKTINEDNKKNIHDSDKPYKIVMVMDISFGLLLFELSRQ